MTETLTETGLVKHNTPVETYALNGQTVYVKREDLSTMRPLPPLAKMRGAEIILARLKAEGVKEIGVYDTKISQAGVGVAALCRALGLKCYLCTPTTNNLAPQHLKAASYGAEIVQVGKGYTQVCYYLAARAMQARGAHMLPFGLCYPESVVAVAAETAMLPLEITTTVKTIVLIVGSATILSGIILGWPGPVNIYAVSAGIANKKQLLNIHNYLDMRLSPYTLSEKLAYLRLIPPLMPYAEPCLTLPPFPCNKYYDRKAWLWLKLNLGLLPGPVLFWNIGGEYEDI